MFFAEVDFVKEFWLSNQRYYLASYVTILFLVGIVCYEGIGFIIELWLNQWIENNKILTKIVKADDKRVFTKIIKFSLWIISLLSEDILKELNEFEPEDVISKHSLKKTIQVIKGVLGFAMLGFVSEIIYWGSTPTSFFIGAYILLSFIIMSFIVIISFCMVVENLDLITMYVREYNVKVEKIKKRKV